MGSRGFLILGRLQWISLRHTFLLQLTTKNCLLHLINFASHKKISKMWLKFSYGHSIINKLFNRSVMFLKIWNNSCVHLYESLTILSSLFQNSSPCNHLFSLISIIYIHSSKRISLVGPVAINLLQIHLSPASHWKEPKMLHCSCSNLDDLPFATLTYL